MNTADQAIATDAHAGHGGSYAFDAQTGERRLVDRTAPPPDTAASVDDAPPPPAPTTEEI